MNAAGRRFPAGWIGGLLCGALASFLPGIGVAAAVLCAPALFALVVDTAPGRPLFRAVCFASLTGSLPWLMRVWADGATPSAALTTLSNSSALASAWLFGAAGWGAALLCPAAFRAASGFAVAREAAALAAKRDALKAEYDL